MVPISEKEWKKIAEVLNVAEEDIYTPEPQSSFVCNGDNNSMENASTYNYYNTPKEFIETQRKYIRCLEEENTALKAQLAALKK